MIPPRPPSAQQVHIVGFVSVEAYLQALIRGNLCVEYCKDLNALLIGNGTVTNDILRCN